MKIDNELKKRINNSVVRIIAEEINIDWKTPYLIKNPKLGQGTGFFINKDGYILTCAHVVNGAKNLYIEIPSIGDEKYECVVIGICPDFDIALIRTKTYRSKYFLELGDSDKLLVGSEVYVVGYPVSLSTSDDSVNNLKYTMGIISGQSHGLIQTDSPINPGNSGGPLILKNKIIGINSMKLVSEGLENIGYSVPIHYYKVIEYDFNKNAKNNYDHKIIYRPDLLFEYENTDAKILEEITNGKVKEGGIIVSKIYDSSTLNKESKETKEKSGIKKGTIITEIDGYKINNYGLTNKRWIGTQISINVLLNNISNNSMIDIKYFDDKLDKIKTKKIKIIPFVPPVKFVYPVFEEVPYFILGGIVFMNFSLNHALNISGQQLGTHNYQMIEYITKKEELLKPKLYVSFVFPNSKVNILNNIQRNDFIKKINNINVNSVHDLSNALKKPIVINSKEYIKIEGINDKSMLLSISDIIQQDLIFSNIYHYPLNDFHEKYLHKYIDVKNMKLNHKIKKKIEVKDTKKE
jgi:serine protease Do